MICQSLIQKYCSFSACPCILFCAVQAANSVANFFLNFKRKLSLSKKVFIDMTKMIKITNDPSLCVCAMLVNYREVATTAACCQGQYHISFLCSGFSCSSVPTTKWHFLTLEIPDKYLCWLRC